MCFRDADDVAVSAEYLSDWVMHDPQMARVCTRKESEIYLDTQHVDYDNPDSVAYMDWQERVVGSRHHITSSVVLSDGLQAGVSLHFSRQQGPATRDVQREIKELFPHFARALKLGFRHAQEVSHNWWEGLSAIGEEPRVLLGTNGKVLRTNPAADLVFARDDGLHLSEERLACEDTRSHDCVCAAVTRVCAPRSGAGSSVMVRRKGGRAPYLVSFYPLVQRRRFLAPFGATALACITDPAARYQGLSDAQKAMLHLTRRESEIARLLVNGHSLASISEMLEISYNTARVHLSSLFAKTNTTRQAELVLFLQRLH
jgi:DNA-binding CsgD family transcriptional regulator